MPVLIIYSVRSARIGEASTRISRRPLSQKINFLAEFIKPGAGQRPISPV
jgi:hypothetical protein